MKYLGPVLDNQARARSIGEEVEHREQQLVVVVDLEVDLQGVEDETGYVCPWLSEARNPSRSPQRVVVVGDECAIFCLVDLVKHSENGTIVHVEILPGIAAEYFEAVARAAGCPRLTNGAS